MSKLKQRRCPNCGHAAVSDSEPLTEEDRTKLLRWFEFLRNAPREYFVARALLGPDGKVTILPPGVRA